MSWAAVGNRYSPFLVGEGWSIVLALSRALVLPHCNILHESPLLFGEKLAPAVRKAPPFINCLGVLQQVARGGGPMLPPWLAGPDLRDVTVFQPW